MITVGIDRLDEYAIFAVLSAYISSLTVNTMKTVFDDHKNGSLSVGVSKFESHFYRTIHC